MKNAMKKEKKFLATALFVFTLLAGVGIFSAPEVANAKDDDNDRNERSNRNDDRNDRSANTSSLRQNGWNFPKHYFSPSYYFPSIIKGEVIAINKNRILVLTGKGWKSRVVNIKITRNTVIVGDPERGDDVRVTAYQDRGGYVAKRIKVIEPGYGE